MDKIFEVPTCTFQGVVERNQILKLGYGLSTGELQPIIYFKRIRNI